MHATIYPGAIQRRYSGVSGIAQPTVSKLVLHSTETTSLPGYSGGSSAPTLTIDPFTRQRWQHFNANESAKALVDPSSTSVRENRDNVAQIEIIGYSDEALAKRYGKNLRTLNQSQIDFIAETIAWYHREWEVPLRTPSAWPMYPASYGANNGARMSGPEYDRFEGVLGHLHVPGNLHGDPSIPISAIMAAAAQTGGGSGPLPPTEEDDMSPEEMKRVLREFFAEGAPGEPAGSVRNTINETYRHTTGEYQRGVVDAVLWSPVAPKRDDQTQEQYEASTPELVRSSWRNNIWHLGLRTEAILKQLAVISEKVGVDVDEEAIVAGVVTAIAPLLTTAVTEAVKAGGEPEAIAQATLDLLIGRLNASEA